MKTHLHHALWVSLVLLAGCSTLGIPQAETFNQRLAAGYTLAAGITDAALIFAQAEKITVDDAQNVRDQTANLKAGLDIVNTLHASNPGAAEDRLTAILASLTALDAYLKSRGTP